MSSPTERAKARWRLSYDRYIMGAGPDREHVAANMVVIIVDNGGDLRPPVSVLVLDWGSHWTNDPFCRNCNILHVVLLSLFLPQW